MEETLYQITYQQSLIYPDKFRAKLIDLSTDEVIYISRKLFDTIHDAENHAESVAN